MLSQSDTGVTQRGTDDIDLLPVFWKLLSWWKVWALFGLLGAIVAFGYSLTIPREYASTSVIYAQDSSGSGLAALVKDLPVSLGSGSGGDYLAALLKSDTMRLRVIRQLKLQDNPKFHGKEKPSLDEVARVYSNRVTVSRDKVGGSITVSATVFDPRLAATVVNKIVDNLGDMVITSSKAKSHFIAKKLGETAALLEEAEDQTRDFQEKNDIAAIDEQAKIFITEMGSLDTKLLDLDVELQGLESRLANAGDPDQLVAMEIQKRSLLSSRAILEAKKKDMMGRVSTLPEVGLQYMRLQRKLAVLGKTYELLTQQYQLAQISQRGEYGDYQVIDRARPVYKKVAPRTMVNAAFGGTLGALLAVILMSVITNARGRRT